MNNNPDNWGFFSPGGTWPEGYYAWTPWSITQFAGIIFFVVLFSSLFWARRWYKYLALNRQLMTVLGCMYLGLFVVYCVLHTIYFYDVMPKVANNFTTNIFKLDFNNVTPKYGNPPPNFENPPVSPPQNWAPLHISSAGEIVAALLLITKSKKLFNITFPVLGTLPIAAVMSPTKVFYGPENYFYYDFYLNHSTMLLIFWFFYLYNVSSYNVNYIRLNFLFGVGMVVTAFIYDWLLNTNLLYVGTEGYALNTTLSTSYIFGGPPSRWQAAFAILVLGAPSILIFYLFIIIIKPLYTYDDKNNHFKRGAPSIAKPGLLALKHIFIWNKAYIATLKRV